MRQHPDPDDFHDEDLDRDHDEEDGRIWRSWVRRSTRAAAYRSVP